jgi:hypothetical protein
MFSRAGLFGLLLCARFYRRLPKSFKMSPFEMGWRAASAPFLEQTCRNHRKNSEGGMDASKSCSFW